MEATDPSTATANPANRCRRSLTSTGSDGRVAYEVRGDGSLVVLVPEMGHLRSSYRFLAPALRDAEYRVAATDLRGHGGNDTSFASYGDVDTAGDIIALIEELDASAERPALVEEQHAGVTQERARNALSPDPPSLDSVIYYIVYMFRVMLLPRAGGHHEEQGRDPVGDAHRLER